MNLIASPGLASTATNDLVELEPVPDLDLGADEHKDGLDELKHEWFIWDFNRS